MKMLSHKFPRVREKACEELWALGKGVGGGLKGVAWGKLRATNEGLENVRRNFQMVS